MFSYNFREDIFYTDNYKTVTGRTLYGELKEGLGTTRPAYALEAYSTSLKYTHTLQMQNNMLIPVSTNRLSIGALYSMLKQDVDNDYVIIIEVFTICQGTDIENLIEYYSGAELKCVANSKENLEMCLSIRNKLKTFTFPIEVKVMHLVNLEKAKKARKLYLPNLNMVLFTGPISPRNTHPLKHYIGDCVPRKLLAPDGVHQTLVTIIDNNNPGRTYYSKIFGEVCKIHSIQNILRKNSILINRYIDNIEVESREIIGLGEAREYGLFTSRIECENSFNIEKILEFKKLELSIEKVDMDRSKNLLDFNLGRSKIRIEEGKNKLEEKRLILDNEKIKVEYIKLDNDILKMAVELRLLDKKLDIASSSNSNVSSVVNNSRNILDLGGNMLKLISNTINLLV